MWKHGRAESGRSYLGTTVVVDHGVYAVVRHPQYLGYMMFAGGFALLWQHWGTLLLAAVAVLGFDRQAIGEEAYCLARFGEPYAQYCRRVPRYNLAVGLSRLAREVKHDRNQEGRSG